MLIFIKSTEQQNNKVKELSGEDTKPKIITHKTQVGKGYLSMILNQRQQTTPASDWEPYQAKHINTT